MDTSPPSNQPKAPSKTRTELLHGDAPAPVNASTKGHSFDDMPEASRQILKESVRTVTGRDDVPPRVGQARLLNDLADAVMTTFKTDGETGGQILGEAPTGVGKALDLDTPIPTPTGWTRMGDLVAGDTVFDEFGAPCTVTHAFMVRNNRPCFEVFFDDGSSIVADGEHLWATQAGVVTTEQMLNGLRDDAWTIPAPARDEKAFYVTAILPVESRPVRCIAVDSENHLFLAGDSSVPTHNSMAYLAPAAAAAAVLNQRTVVSTEMISLQTQIIDKDAPVVMDACEKVTGYRPSVALLKGWSNYACFDGDEEFVTRDGVRKFRDLAGQSTFVLDGDRNWAEAEIRSFGAQRLTRLTVSRGNVSREILTTADHRWFVNPNANYDSHVETVTSDLKPGDRLTQISVKNKVKGRSKPSPVGICAGLVFGDGSRFRSTDEGVHQGACTIPLHGEKNIDLLKHFDGIGTWGDAYERDTHAEPIVRVSNLPSFFKSLPDPTWNTSYLYGWLAGYFAADGTVSPNGSASISSADRTHLEFVMSLCEALGIAHGGRISKQSRQGYNPEGVETDIYKLAIHAGSLDEDFFLVEEHRCRFLATLNSYRRWRSVRRWKVKSVVETDEVREVFCAVVPTTQSFALVGNILTGNCAASTVDSAEALLGIEVHKTGLNKIQYLREKMREHLAKTTPTRNADGTLDFSKVARGTVTSANDREKAELVTWALDQAASVGEKRPDETGDKNHYEGSLTDSMTWDSVAVSSSDCIGADKCALSDFCLPGKAREKASEADIVVTNHHLLAVQAAKGVPVVIGSRKIGNIDHLVIDEAHGLPSIVRSQGSVEVSSRTIKRAAKSITRVMDDTDPKVMRMVKDGEAIAARVEMELDEWSAKIKRGEDVYRLGHDDDPVNDTSLLVENWTKNAHLMLNQAGKTTANVATHMKIRRAKNSLDALEEAVKLVSEHNPGTARWVEIVRPHFKAADQSPYPSAQYTPVDVATLLRFNLWSVEDTEAMEAQAEVHEGEGPPPRLNLTVAALSATLPKGFGRQMGIRASLAKYESPFDDAYGASVLFVPRAPKDSPDVEALKRPFPGKPKFDTSRHTDWAAEHVLNLVEANGGSALILAATASAGRVYAERLKVASRGRWNVLSQWDGQALRKQVTDWKADTNAVLVGTKSLMTGVDASGATCTLVVVDRPARARSNPVDDARVEMLMESLDMDKWGADRLTYVSDAGMLLEQAAGRLIRTVTDSGMVAVLDPRLLKTSPFAYNHATRTDYLETLHRFETKISDPAKATAWLREHKALVTKKAS